MIQLARTDSSNPDFQKLIGLLDAGLRITDGDDFAFFAQYNKVDTIKEVVVAYTENIAVGCGAFKPYDAHTAEIKRMFVRPEYRGKGIAKAVLAALEAWARESGFTHTILETSDQLTAAIALYETSGYNRIPNYGQYENVASSICMRKEL